MNWPSCSPKVIAILCWSRAAETSWRRLPTSCRDKFGIAVKTIALDLSQALAPHFLFDQLRRERISIDILINNAGYGRFGEFADLPLEESLGQIQLNVMALTALTKVFISQML